MGQAFEDLRTFVTEKMRMSHIYQPVMLRVLLENGGRASRNAIAKAFVAEDRSQIEYYETIVRDMPGRVLASHAIVERIGADYRLTEPYANLSYDERQALIQDCQAQAIQLSRKAWAGTVAAPEAINGLHPRQPTL